MPNSVRCIIKKCLHKGAINQQEYDKIMRKLDEPIRCKDCKSWDTSWVPQSAENGYYWCSENDTYFKGDEFCSRAERREDE